MQKEILSHTCKVILKLPHMYEIQISCQVTSTKVCIPLKKKEEENTRSHFHLTTSSL